ncbi:MAG: gamma-glutamyl-gamma-aminobutyrate hydrolase family protein [Bacteroidota bacterium]
MKIAVTDTGRPVKQKLYVDWLQSFDANAQLVNVSYTSEEHDLSEFDGLVLTGGEDVDPLLSKASPVELVEAIDRQRDDLEFHLLDQAIKLKMPILGICRGLQVTNVFLGGTLIADLPNAGYRPHTAAKDEPVMHHTVRVNEDSILNTVTGRKNGQINSYHHQAVLESAPDLLVTGQSEDGVVEALEWKERAGKSPMLLVQWHPERMTDRSNPFTTAVGSFFFTEAKKFNSTK